MCFSFSDILRNFENWNHTFIIFNFFKIFEKWSFYWYVNLAHLLEVTLNNVKIENNNDIYATTPGI